MIQPPILKLNDKAVIVSPAGNIEAEIVYKTANVLEGWGLNVNISKHALSHSGRFSGTVEQRLADLQEAMDDPSVNLIFCSRGGYGAVHLLDKLDFSGIKKHPKWIIGFSDITALHAILQSHGIMSVHGPMAKHFAEEGSQDIAVQYMEKILKGRFVNYDIEAGQNHHLNRAGIAKGKIFGGNLAVFCGLLGSKFNKIPNKGILFIEDIGEEPYKVDRYVHQMKLAGIFDRISGLIIGRFTDYEEDSKMYHNLYESIAKAVEEYKFPTCFDFPVGHVQLNLPLVMGKTSDLIVEDNLSCLKTTLII